MRLQRLSAGGRIATGFFLLWLLLIPLSRMNTFAQEQPVPEEVANAERGLLIYEARCADCHGLTGGGDGAMAGDSIQPPTVFADPAFRLTAVPSEMYNVIVNGRMDQGMPPFGPENSNPLSDQDVWDLIAAIYSFSTPGETYQQGRDLFMDQINPDGELDITNLSFWATQSNAEIAERFRSEGLLINADLPEEEVMALVDFGRGMLSYAYTDPFQAAQPIETAVVSGAVTNGTTEEVAGDLVVRLRAFTQELQESFTISTTVGTDGNYSFDLQTVPPDWIYIVSTNYDGFQFSSAPGMLDPVNPALDMPITIYNGTTSDEAVSVDQIHTILNFVGEQLEVTQVIRYSNSAPSLYVGQTGDAANGTIQIPLPPEAQNPSFERGFGSMESFIPAAEIIQTEGGWADTLPLRPGQGVVDLLVTYSLPYGDELSFSQQLPYPVTSGTLIMPSVGVALEAEGWILEGESDFSGGTFLSYANPDMTELDTLRLTLDGKPEQTIDVQGNVVPVRNETNDMIVGGASVLIAAGAALFVFQSWRRQTDILDEDDPDELLEAIVELDEAFEAGEVSRAAYEEEREALKEALLDVWGEDV